ncbi:MAG: stage III sporulation protein AB [Clostridiales bacterium]|jgi:stage III sporulation protein AB|nr:stage III sporulation protein AB [Clostridiales bacterium]
MLKLVGGLLLFAASSIIGFRYSIREKLRINSLSEMRKALMILKSEISFSENSLTDAFSYIAKNTDGSIGDFFAVMAKKLRTGESFSKIWDSSLAVLGDSKLAEEDKREFSRLSKTIGIADKRFNEEIISALVRYIDDKVESLYKESEKNRPLFGSLGILCGLLITVAVL